MPIYTERPLSLSDFQDWMVVTETLYASAFSEGKKLTVSTNGTIRVYHLNKVVWQGIQPFAAIEKYNSL